MSECVRLILDLYSDELSLCDLPPVLNLDTCVPVNTLSHGITMLMLLSVCVEWVSSEVKCQHHCVCQDVQESELCVTVCVSVCVCVCVSECVCVCV